MNKTVTKPVGWRIAPLLVVLMGILLLQISSNSMLDAEQRGPSVINVPGDSRTIQAAIEAVEEGGTISVSPGVYQENLFIDKGVTLEGADRGSTIIEGSQGKDLGLPVIFISATSDVTIRGFTIRGGYLGIRVEDSSGITISGNLIVDNIGKGVFVLGSSEVELVENQITGTTSPKEGILGRGIDLEGSFEVKVTDNLVSGNAGAGIRLSNSTAEITGGKIDDNGSVGLFAGNKSVVILSDSELSGNVGVGVLLTDSSRGGIVNSEITHTRPTAQGELGIGMVIEEGSEGTLLGNVISGNASYGVFLVKEAVAHIKENTVSENGLEGIYIAGGSSAEVIGNSIAKNVFAGVHIAEKSKAVVEGNEITGNLPTGDGRFGRGINIRANSIASIVGNTISANAEDGISVFDSSAEIRDNTIKDNGDCGIFANENARITGGGNEISGNGRDLCNVSEELKK